MTPRRMSSDFVLIDDLDASRNVNYYWPLHQKETAAVTPSACGNVNTAMALVVLGAAVLVWQLVAK